MSRARIKIRVVGGGRLSGDPAFDDIRDGGTQFLRER
jgi:hypothetical protein